MATGKAKGATAKKAPKSADTTAQPKTAAAKASKGDKLLRVRAKFAGDREFGFVGFRNQGRKYNGDTFVIPANEFTDVWMELEDGQTLDADPEQSGDVTDEGGDNAGDNAGE